MIRTYNTDFPVKSVTVSATVYKIDSWDGTDAHGRDYFSI